MRIPSILSLVGIGLLVATPLAHADKTVSREDVLQAIEIFQKDPSSKEGFAAGDTILSYAQKSAMPHHLSKAIVPWMKNGDDVSDADTRHMLLIAYLAGNIQAEVKNGKTSDDVYTGWQQVLVTYAQLLQINPAAKVSEVDDLKKKDAAGELRSYAAEVERG